MSKKPDWWMETESRREVIPPKWVLKMWRARLRQRIPHGIRHTILRPAFWLGVTISFPLEHFIWEKLWPFSAITRWLGL
jgi:hypothetical protein